MFTLKLIFDCPIKIHVLISMVKKLSDYNLIFFVYMRKGSKEKIV